MRRPAPELISILVPVYNEARTVGQVIDRLLQIPLPAPREIIVVNDGSTDGTRQVLDGLAPVDGVLSIVHARANGGKGSAIRIGLAQARGTIIAIQDADLELDPVQLASLVQPILDGEARGRVWLQVSDGPRFGPVAVYRRQSRTDAAHQRALRRPPHRYGDLLQDHGCAGGARADARIEPLRHRTGNHRQAAEAAPPHRRAAGRHSIRAAAPVAKRLAGATASTPSRCS